MDDQSGWVGMYCAPDRMIKLDRNASVDDLLYVINELGKEMDHWRSKALLRDPFTHSATPNVTGDSNG